MSGFIQLAHVGFHKDIGKNAHGILHIYRPYVAELCASSSLVISSEVMAALISVSFTNPWKLYSPIQRDAYVD